MLFPPMIGSSRLENWSDAMSPLTRWMMRTVYGGEAQ